MSKRAQKIANQYNKTELKAFIAAKKREIVKAAKNDNSLLWKNLTGELKLMEKALELKSAEKCPAEIRPETLEQMAAAGKIFKGNATEKYKRRIK